MSNINKAHFIKLTNRSFCKNGSFCGGMRRETKTRLFSRETYNKFTLNNGFDCVVNNGLYQMCDFINYWVLNEEDIKEIKIVLLEEFVFILNFNCFKIKCILKNAIKGYYDIKNMEIDTELFLKITSHAESKITLRSTETCKNKKYHSCKISNLKDTFIVLSNAKTMESSWDFDYEKNHGTILIELSEIDTITINGG